MFKLDENTFTYIYTREDGVKIGVIEEWTGLEEDSYELIRRYQDSDGVFMWECRYMNNL